MDSRRRFLQRAGALAASAAAWPAALRRALAIEPPAGSTFMDAEHVVILMQENRSFDHCYGSLQGVRGFNDPRAVSLPDGNPVWLQSNAAGETFAPFRLDLKGSNATWLGCLPHDWADQARARNEGRHDRWLDFKQSSRESCAGMPLTLGYYTREDLPFYYALADAFTVCDQNFCSTLTGTNPNRLHLWSGTIRPEPHPDSKAYVRNSDAEVPEGVPWKSFPERLEEHGISWRVYQNELWHSTGLSEEEQSWLGNFGDNALEYFARYRIRLAKRYREHLPARLEKHIARINELAMRTRPWTAAEDAEYERALKRKALLTGELETWTAEKWESLPEGEKELHRKAFTTNEGDSRFRELEDVTYFDGGVERTMKAPRGDIFHQFRSDVKNGKLPAVSWLVAPQVFSDHPDSPWYGAWYIAEALDILTSKPDVWKKTIFILCYDENDGYFDHVPPFVPPDPDKPESGRASAGLQTELEFVRTPQEEEHSKVYPHIPAHTGPFGLGYRVPLVIASPWSRGGYVNSQVFDHTSILRFLEVWLTGKTGREIRETNITPWRRAICGDLTSVFRSAAGDTGGNGAKVARQEFLGAIHMAQFRPGPGIPRPLATTEISAAREALEQYRSTEILSVQQRASLRKQTLAPVQEPGTRPACALPYELEVSGALIEPRERKQFVIRFAARKDRFGERAAGAPFHVYAPVPCRTPGVPDFQTGRTWAFAVAAGQELTRAWPLADFAGEKYHLRVHGPNGFFREFRGRADDPAIDVQIVPRAAGSLQLLVTPRDANQRYMLFVHDEAYGSARTTIDLAGAARKEPLLLHAGQHGWYDFRISIREFPEFSQRFAGHVESGGESRTDPLMGGSA